MMLSFGRSMASCGKRNVKTQVPESKLLSAVGHARRPDEAAAEKSDGHRGEGGTRESAQPAAEPTLRGSAPGQSSLAGAAGGGPAQIV